MAGRRSLLARGRNFLLFLPARLGYRLLPRVASALRKWWVIARNPHATIRFEGPAYLGPGFSLHMPDGGEFIVGPGVEFRRNFRCEMSGNGRVTIGKGCHFTYDVLIQCSTLIEIGDDVSVGYCSSIHDGKHRYRDLSRPVLAQGYDFAPVRIEHGAVVHSLCTVLASVGERAILGANAVVAKPIPAFTVAVGVPARPIDYFGPEAAEPTDLREAIG